MTDLEGGEISVQSPPVKENVFSCGICYEDFDTTDNSVEIKMLEKCNHTFCGDCFKEYFRSMIED